eukprot:481543-Prymnesium_polylepis.1
MSATSTASAASLCCDYYAECGVRDRLTPIGAAKSKATVEKALLSTTFESSVMMRLPLQDRQSVSFAPEVGMFCFPVRRNETSCPPPPQHGVRLVTPEEAAANAIPVVTSFVLTAADKTRMYGACIVWYELLHPDVVQAYLDENMQSSTDEESQPHEPPVLHAPEAIVLLSRVAIFDAMMECCRQLFRMRITSDTPLSEDALAQLLHTSCPRFGAWAPAAAAPCAHVLRVLSPGMGSLGVPSSRFAPAVGTTTRIELGNVSVPFSVPAANQLPHTMAGRDFLLLFQALEVGNVIMLWALLLAEQKVVLQGKQPHVLTMAAETLCALLFPFSWQHVYIPILPARLLDILQAPVPFLMGIDEDVLALAEKQGMIPNDVVQVDLDRNEILCDPEVANKMHLPQKQYHKLYKAIAPFCRRPNADADANGENAASAFPMAPPPDVNIDEHVVTVAEMSEEAVASAISSIKAAFLRFFVSIMAKYQDVMIVPPSHIKLPAAIDFFDVRKWMLRFSGSCSDWLEMFTAGQSFTQWLEQRLAPRDSPLLE